MDLDFDRARATEKALEALRAEFVELNTGGLRAAAPGMSAEAVLGTSVDDLARMHEGHASNMRELGQALRSSADGMPSSAYPSCYYSTSSAMQPQPSAEPDLELTGRRFGGACHSGLSDAVGVSTRRDFSRSLLPTDAQGQPAVSASASRPDFSRPLLPDSARDTTSAAGGRPTTTPSSSLEAMPMQRSALQRREAANAAMTRAEGVTANRFAREAALRREAAARVDAARERALQRSSYVINRSASDFGEDRRPASARSDRDGGTSASYGGGGSARPAASARCASASAATARSSEGALQAAAQQRLAASVAAVPIRMPRPRSAPKERPRITVPTPFSFEHRPKIDHAAQRRMLAEVEQDKALLEEARKENMSVKARSPPPTNAPGLYTQKVLEMEQRSKERRTVRRTVPQPFSFANRGTRSLRASSTAAEFEAGAAASGPPADEYALAAAESYSGEEGDVGGRPSFKAREVPRSMSEPRWEMMRVREAERREKVAQDALRLAQKSRLPPRMQQHKETARARKAAEAERIQAEMDADLTLKPRITEGVPDFDHLHMTFEKEQSRKRQEYRPTVPTPFRMESVRARRCPAPTCPLHVWTRLA